MEEYDVCLNMHIVVHDGSSWVAQWVKMPFVPQSGLQIWLGPGDLDWDHTLTVESVVWNAAENDVAVCLQDYEGAATDTLATLLSQFKAAGWESTGE